MVFPFKYIWYKMSHCQLWGVIISDDLKWGKNNEYLVEKKHTQELNC